MTTTSVIELRRKIDTGDTQDRPFEDGLRSIIWAYGSSDSFMKHDNDKRGINKIHFWGAGPPAVPTGAQTLDVTVTDYPIPVVKTTYYNFMMELPTDKQYHMIAAEPVVANNNDEHLHHFVAYFCTSNTSCSDIVYA